MIEPKDQNPALFPFLIIAFAVLSFGKSMLLHDVAWDDNCWILSYYFTDSLNEFLDTGFYELKRVPMGVLYYYYYSLHKLTDYAHLIWNSFNMIIQVLAPITLYFLINNLFGRKRFLAFLIAMGFIICPLDMTLPYYANINYRLGTFCCILSFYLTERALSRKDPWALIVAAMASSGFALYFLLEAAMTLELARLFLIWHVLSQENIDKKTLIKRSLKFWLPFVFLCVPIALYRLISKPYGIYATTYTMNPLFFLNLKMHIKILRHFLFYNWFIFIWLITNTTVSSVVIGLVAIFTGFYTSRGLPLPEANGPCDPSGFKKRFISNLKPLKKVLIFGLLLVIPALMLYEFSGRVPAPGMEGRHGSILLFGYAIAFGSLLYALYSTLVSTGSTRKWARTLIILFIGLGVFFNNVNLDLYAMGTEYQKSFWQKFTTRFPVLPDKGLFLIDAGENSPYYNADLEAYYELELPLNILYARSERPDKFLNYRVYAVSEGIRDEWKKPGNLVFKRFSHAGEDTFNTKEMIFVYYRGGEILINRDILDKHPDVPYRMWLDKDPPAFTGDLPEYPLRHKFMGS